MYPKMFRMYRTKRAVYLNDWCWDAESGDLYIDTRGRLFRLQESRGRNKAAAGELTPMQIKPPEFGLYAALINGRVWWMWEDEPYAGRRGRLKREVEHRT